jgi:hypothetical protein
MKHRPRFPEQDDLLCPRLVDLIDLRHELMKFAALVDWEFFEWERGGLFPSATSRPATSLRLVAGTSLSSCLPALGPGGGRTLGREPVLPTLH